MLVSKKKFEKLEIRCRCLETTLSRLRVELNHTHDKLEKFGQEMEALLAHLQLDKVKVKPGIKFVSKSSASLGD